MFVKAEGNKAYLRATSGISPVIASVILIAAAIVLTASLSGFASSLVGTYSASPHVSIKSMEVDEHGKGKIVLYNAGAETDSIITLQAAPNTAINPAGGGSVVIGGPANNGNNPSPQCTQHSQQGNCLQDQGHGGSGSSNGHNNNSGNNISGSGNTNGASYILLAPNSETDVLWTDASLGEFAQGQLITIELQLGSGNSLTYTTNVVESS